ncbi:MAG: methyltransferase domain-containing protein [Phycisphaeraceae bacterium]|nr:methyltransferase domain-containing protein [Phycisphaeraceae bacterium]
MRRETGRQAQPTDQDGAPTPAAASRFLRGGLRIVFENDDLIVVDKPTGMITASPTPTREPTAFDILKVEMKGRRGARRPRRADGPPPQPVYVVHRLDKEASGIVVFAKTPKAFNWLKEDFRAKRVHRIYAALVEGTLGKKGDTGTIQSFLKEDATGRVRSIDPDAFRGSPAGAPPRERSPRPHGRGRGEEAEPAKLAVTHYRVLGAAEGLTLLQVRLETGRKNQIRVHLAERGHPLVGDQPFGSLRDPIGRLGLHASELSFADPATGRTLRFSSPPTAGFFRAVGLEPPKTVESPAPSASEPVPSDRGGNTSWEAVAGWYDQMHERGNDHYQQVILPGVLRLLQPDRGQQILDVACGQGILSRHLAALGVHATGVEASPSLVELARQRGSGAEGVPPPAYLVGDARDLSSLGPDRFDAAACVMALGNIEPLEPVMKGVADALKPGGRFVFVVSHPAFRAAGQTSWGWDDAAKLQFRRVDGYLSAGQKEIEMHPGRRAQGAGGATTWSFHRPIQTYVRTLIAAGFLIQALEEWPGQRTSEPGPRAKAENRARREIPLFLGIRAVKPA